MKWLLNIEGIKKIKTLAEFERWEKIEDEKEEEEKNNFKKITTLEKFKNLEDAKKIHKKLKTSDRITGITRYYKDDQEKEMKKVVIKMRINGNIERKILIN